MVDTDSVDALTDDVFRARFRSWLEANYPEAWRDPLELRLHGESERKWLGLLHEHGWRAPGWPRESGGLGLSLRKQLIYHEELERHRAARFIDFGGTLLGPILIRFGTREQRERYLPAILKGDDLWCQGYSEPNAGSDLAALGLTATRDGDGFVVNGSKIWTTHASDATRMFFLARTGKGGRKQEGISFLMVSMSAPGITVRPIVNLAGEAEFAQVFFDDVRVPTADLVHEVDKGWDVARALLGFERVANGSPHLARQALATLDRLASAMGRSEDAVYRDARARLACDLNDASALHRQVCARALEGEVPPYLFSMLKIAASELWQRTMDLLMSIAGEQAGARGAAQFGDCEVDLHRLYMIARPSSIYSGTNEVQRNIIARTVFGR